MDAPVSLRPTLELQCFCGVFAGFLQAFCSLIAGFPQGFCRQTAGFPQDLLLNPLIKGAVRNEVSFF
jgi:hypothetical protein